MFCHFFGTNFAKGNIQCVHIYLGLLTSVVLPSDYFLILLNLPIFLPLFLLNFLAFSPILSISFPVLGLSLPSNVETYMNRTQSLSPRFLTVHYKPVFPFLCFNRTHYSVWTPQPHPFLYAKGDSLSFPASCSVMLPDLHSAAVTLTSLNTLGIFLH